MHDIRYNIIQKSLVMSDYNSRFLRGMKGIHTVCNDSECIHIKSAVSLVKDSKSRIQHRHLENLVTFLLATGESHIDLSLCELRLHLHECHLFTKKFKEITGLERLESLSSTMRIDSCLHKVSDGHSRNLHRVLERKEDSRPGTLFRRHCQQILSEELDGSGCDSELRFSCKNS